MRIPCFDFLEKGPWTVTNIGKEVEAEIARNQIIDCTRNAFATSLAGYDVLRETDTQPGSLIFRIGGYQYDGLDLTQIPTKNYGTLGQKMIINEKTTNPEGTFPPNVLYGYVYVPGADSTTAESHTLANTQGRTNLLTLLRELRTYPGCEKIGLLDLKTETAVRETYSIDGEYQTRKQT